MNGLLYAKLHLLKTQLYMLPLFVAILFIFDIDRKSIDVNLIMLATAPIWPCCFVVFYQFWDGLAVSAGYERKCVVNSTLAVMYINIILLEAVVVICTFIEWYVLGFSYKHDDVILCVASSVTAFITVPFVYTMLLTKDRKLGPQMGKLALMCTIYTIMAFVSALLIDTQGEVCMIAWAIVMGIVSVACYRAALRYAEKADL